MWGGKQRFCCDCGRAPSMLHPKMSTNTEGMRVCVPMSCASTPVSKKRPACLPSIEATCASNALSDFPLELHSLEQKNANFEITCHTYLDPSLWRPVIFSGYMRNKQCQNLSKRCELLQEISRAQRGVLLRQIDG